MYRAVLALFTVLISFSVYGQDGPLDTLPGEPSVDPGVTSTPANRSGAGGVTRLKQKVLKNHDFGESEKDPTKEKQPAKVWKSRDANGNVVFSDQPPEKGEQAEEVTVSEPNTMPAPLKEQQTTMPGTSSGNPPEQQTVKSVRITAPENEQHFHNQAEPIAVQVEVDPALGEAQLLRLLDNGEAVIEGKPGELKLDYPDRGTHKLQVQVVNQDGEVVVESEVLTIYVHRASALHPNRRKPAPEKEADSLLAKTLKLVMP